MEDIHICNSVCLRYVDDKKLSVFQSNVKYLKLKNIQKYLILVLWLVKRVSFTSFDEDNIFCTLIALMCRYHQWVQVAVMTYYSNVKVKIFTFRAFDRF